MRRCSKSIFFLALLLTIIAFWVVMPSPPSRTPNAKSLPVESSVKIPMVTRAPNTTPTSKPVIAPIVTKSAVAVSNTITPVTFAEGQISPAALRQISALETEKSRRTPAQNKMDSQLLYADRMRRGMPVAEGVPTQRVDLDQDEQGRVLVDLKAEIAPELLGAIAASGGHVINSFPEYHAARASIPLAEIETLAARDDVTFVEPAVRAVQNSVDSQGDYAHLAFESRAAYGVNGTNISVGVLSSGVEYLASSQIAGLVTVIPGQSGPTNSGEGTALLEIVHDLAPGAQLLFATAGGSEANYAANMQLLRAAGCGILVDDSYYYDESPFQDALLAQTVNSLTAGGALYFSAAGNTANKYHGFSGTWEGDFVDGGQALGLGASGRMHSFGAQNYNTVTTGLSSPLHLDLFWSDPLGASTNDYDLFLLDSTGSNVITSSTNPQNGTQDPYESIGAVTNGQLVVIVRHSGAGRFLHLSTGGGRLSINTSGSTRGHSCATNAFNITAVDATLAGGGTNAFAGGGQDYVDYFGSDGPRRVFYQADGAPITPGNFSSTGGAVRQKPDLTAADDVSTDLPGFAFNPFHGTSAAAPHAAAIAALVQSYNPFLTTAQIRTILTSNALDIEVAGPDADSGYGIVMASTALAATPPPPPPAISILSPASAAWGRPIYIYGTNFSPATGVQFNGVPSVYTVASNTLIIAKVPAGAATGPLTISTPGGATTTGFVVLPAVAPANDNFANAQVVTGEGVIVSTSTYGATREIGEPNHAGNPGGKSVWYQWTAPGSGPYFVDTGGSDFSTLLAVYTGSALTNLSVVASNSTAGGNGINHLSFNATNGATYVLAVDGFNGASGSAVLRLVESNASLAPVILLGPQNQTVTAGADVFLSAVAFGASPLTYQWSFGTNAINNATNAALLLKDATPSQSGAYSILVTNLNGAAGNFAIVTITNPLPQAQFGKINFSAASGLTLNLALAVGNNYSLQTSTNLSNWTTLTSFYANGSNTVCLDPAATNFSSRYYRLVSP